MKNLQKEVKRVADDRVVTKQYSKKMNGHISSYELEKFFDWLLAPEGMRKPAVLNWTSGLARQLGYIIERYYTQKKKPDYPSYDKIFSTKPFMCEHCEVKRCEE